MNINGRARRWFLRELTSPGLYAKRKTKAHVQWERWWKSHLLVPFDFGGDLCWKIAPTSRKLIHKGRKP